MELSQVEIDTLLEWVKSSKEVIPTLIQQTIVEMGCMSDYNSAKFTILLRRLDNLHYVLKNMSNVENLLKDR